MALTTMPTTSLARISILVLGAWLLAPSGANAREAADGTLLGVLEEVPGVYVGESSHYGVRVLFQNVGDEWRVFPDVCENTTCLASITAKYPVKVQWTILRKGRPVGTVAAHTPEDFKFYAHIGLQDLDPGQSVPDVGPRSAKYSGFEETPVSRPLVATSGPVVPAPSHGDWKSAAAESSDVARVWTSFRNVVPLIDDCRLDSRGEFIPSNGRHPRRNELEIASKWVNSAGDAIIQARVRSFAFKDCDGPPSHASEYWFYRESSGNLWPLPGQSSRDTRAELLMPLDFVAMPVNDRDVALFLMSGYDAGGYALYFDGFRKVAMFKWIYH